MEKLLGLPVMQAKQTGPGTDDLIVYIHYLMFALFIGWLIFFLFTCWRFNAKRNPKADYHGVRNHFSSYLELAVAGIEVALLFFVAYPIWAHHVDSFPDAKESSVVQVVAQQFAWNFRFPGKDGEFGKQDIARVSADNAFGVDPADEHGKDDIQTVNEMHVPVNKPVICYISSKDVIHSFRLITMRVTQDAVPGMRIPIHFTPVKTGVSQIYCAQLCGNGHAAMASGRLHVDTPEDYQKWVDSQSKSGAGGASLE